MTGLDPASLSVAFAAGAVSFLSPCFLPLVPGYVAFMSGGRAEDRLLRVALFVFGFALIFTALGLGSGFAGGLLLENRREIEIVGGIFIALLGVAMLLPRLPFWLGQERRLDLARPVSNVSTVGVGMAFAVGWSPCIGPTLAAVLTLAATSGETATGGILLFTFALGLGLPFLLVGMSLNWAERLVTRLRLHTQAARIVGASVLVVFGILLAIGTIGDLSARLTSLTPVTL